MSTMTIEQAASTVVALKGLLAKAATDGCNAEELMSRALSIATAEGHLTAVMRYESAIEQGASPERALQHVTRTALNGPDDSWSGRQNDGKRAFHDGFLRAVREFTEAAL